MQSKIIKPQVHGVFDSASLKRQSEGHRQEEHRSILENGAIAAEMTSRYLLENDLGNFEKQAGKKLQLTQFEQRVTKLVPALRFNDRILDETTAAFLHMSTGATVRIMSQLLPDGELKYVCSYPKTELVHEFTIILMKKVKIPTVVNKVSAKDFPKVIINEFGERVFDGATPFDKFSIEPSGTFPGWRTALARLIGLGLLTPTQAESEFGSVDNASWALRTGKQDTSATVQV